jgi:hypothetical protein
VKIFNVPPILDVFKLCNREMNEIFSYLVKLHKINVCFILFDIYPFQKKKKKKKKSFGTF